MLIVCIFKCDRLCCRLGCIILYYNISHPRMILSVEDVQVPRPLEREALDEIVAEDDGEHGFLELGGRLGRIRNHVYVVMSSGMVPQGSEEWSYFEEVLREVHGGKVYRRRRYVGGGRG